MVEGEEKALGHKIVESNSGFHQKTSTLLSILLGAASRSPWARRLRLVRIVSIGCPVRIAPYVPTGGWRTPNCAQHLMLTRFVMPRNCVHPSWDHDSSFGTLDTIGLPDASSFRLGIVALAYCGPARRKSSAVVLRLGLPSPHILRRRTLDPPLNPPSAPWFNAHRIRLPRAELRSKPACGPGPRPS